MEVIVIGGGPSGLMSAIKAAESCKVTLIEKNEKVGKKIYITGKGRCNVTNNCTNQEFIQKVVNNSKFLFSAINNFSCLDTMDFFKNAGVKLVTERGNRVFPYSYHASDITKALVLKCEENNVDIKLNEVVNKVTKINDKFEVITSKRKYIADKVIIATGGISYPQTGSTGDGYRFAEVFNHQIVSPVGGLVPLLVKDEFPKEMYNFTLKNVILHSKNKKTNKIIRSEFGELMIMKKAIAGPITLTISSLINRVEPMDIDLEIDLKPALDEETLFNRITKEIEELKSKNLSNTYVLLRRLVPIGLISMILKRCSIDSNLKVKFLQENHIKSIINVLKHFKLDYQGLEVVDRAIITSGGVSVKEVNPKTFESKLISGLYFVGEVLDVDAFTGGFNMQIALSTGFAAGKYIGE